MLNCCRTKLKEKSCIARLTFYMTFVWCDCIHPYCQYHDFTVNFECIDDHSMDKQAIHSYPLAILRLVDIASNQLFHYNLYLLAIHLLYSQHSIDLISSILSWKGSSYELNELSLDPPLYNYSSASIIIYDYGILQGQ